MSLKEQLLDQLTPSGFQSWLDENKGNHRRWKPEDGDTPAVDYVRWIALTRLDVRAEVRGASDNTFYIHILGAIAEGFWLILPTWLEQLQYEAMGYRYARPGVRDVNDMFRRSLIYTVTKLEEDIKQLTEGDFNAS